MEKLGCECESRHWFLACICCHRDLNWAVNVKVDTGFGEEEKMGCEFKSRHWFLTCICCLVDLESVALSLKGDNHICGCFIHYLMPLKWEVLNLKADNHVCLHKHSSGVISWF